MLCRRRIAGFATAVHTGSDWLGFAAGVGAGALLAALFGVLVIWLNTNQYATGPGAEPVRRRLLRLRRHQVRRRRSCPSGRASRFPCWPTSRWSARRCSASTRWSTSRSRWRSGWSGSCTARAPGWCCARSANRPSRRMRWAIRCARIRLAAVVVGGALCGLAGAYISVVYTPLWVEGMVAGQGLDRAGAHDLRHLAAGARAARRLPVRRRDHAAVPPAGRGRARSPSQFLGMLPYLATIVVLVLISRNPRVDPRQHAGLARQAVLSRHMIAAFSARPPRRTRMTDLEETFTAAGRRLLALAVAGARRLQQEGDRRAAPAPAAGAAPRRPRRRPRR